MFQWESYVRLTFATPNPYGAAIAHRKLGELFSSLSYSHTDRIWFKLLIPNVYYTSLSSEQKTTAGQQDLQLANAAPPPPYLFISRQWRYLAGLTSLDIYKWFSFLLRIVFVVSLPPPRLTRCDNTLLYRTKLSIA